MSTPENSRLSYVRASREVLPNMSLERFLAKVTEIGIETFGHKDSTMHRQDASRDEELRPGFRPQHRGLMLPAATIYPANDLRLTLFRRLATPSYGVNSAFSKVYARMSATELPTRRSRLKAENLDVPTVTENPVLAQLRQAARRYAIADPDEVRVTARSLGVSTQTEYEHLGTEYALVIDEGNEQSFLQEEANIIFRSVKAMGVGSQLCRPPDNQPTVADRIPIARLPVNTDEQQELHFVERVEDACRSLSRIALGTISWNAQNPRTAQTQSFPIPK